MVPGILFARPIVTPAMAAVTPDQAEISNRPAAQRRIALVRAGVAQ